MALIPSGNFIMDKDKKNGLGFGHITIGSLTSLLFGIILLSNLERSLGISPGISVGAFMGLIIARYLDSQAKDSGNSQ